MGIPLGRVGRLKGKLARPKGGTAGMLGGPLLDGYLSLRSS